MNIFKCSTRDQIKTILKFYYIPFFTINFVLLIYCSISIMLNSSL